MVDIHIHSMYMTSPPDDVNRVHEFLEQVWEDAPTIGMMDRFGFETALVELAANIFRHADIGDGLECNVRVETGDKRIVALLTDSGAKGNIYLGDADMPDEMEENGRGLLLIKALVDELHYERQGEVNQWRISKKLVP